MYGGRGKSFICKLVGGCVRCRTETYRHIQVAGAVLSVQGCYLIGKQNAQVAQVIPCWPGDYRVAERIEKWIGIESGETPPDGLDAAGADNSTAIDHRTCGRTIAVDTVRPRAEYRDVFSGNWFGTSERELLIASADATVADGHRYFPTREQTDSRHFAAQFPDPPDQISRRFFVGPIVAGIVDFDGKACPRSSDRSLVECNFI